jgi:CubicO group peptidase (beta-lactamase class C family)
LETPGAPEGQVVLSLSSGPGDLARQSATFVSPNGHATLRVQASADARGSISLNDEDVSPAIFAPGRGTSAAIDISSFVREGENTLAVQFVSGGGYVSIDYPALVRVDAAAAGWDPAAFEDLDAYVAGRAGTGLSSPTRFYSGAVVLVAHRARIVHEVAIGHAQTHHGTGRTYEPEIHNGVLRPLEPPREMTTDTIFDMASVTKVEATAAAMLRLVDKGVLNLDDTLGRFLPEFPPEIGQITLRRLATHTSGLWEWQPTYLHGRNEHEVLEFLAGLPLRYAIGAGHHYSDIGGGMLPGAIIERVTGQRLDQYLRGEIYQPLGMTDTGYTPDATLRNRIAATSFGNPYEYTMINTGRPYPVADKGRSADFDGWRDHALVGEANDGNTAYGWQGVAGHAGLFSTAKDLAIYGQTLNNGGGYANARLASADTVNSFLVEPYDSGQAIWFRSRRWPGMSALPASQRGFGHEGFTGTELLFDPGRDVVVVLLTNHLHPDEPYRSITATLWSGVLSHVLAAMPSEHLVAGAQQ